MKKKIQITVLACLLMALPPMIARCGRLIDQQCVLGRLSDDQAALLNLVDWQKQNKNLPLAFEGDRVFASECSELLRIVTFRNWF